MASNITRMPRGVPAQAQQQAAPGQQWWGGMPGWGGGGWWNGDCDDAIPPFPCPPPGWPPAGCPPWFSGANSPPWYPGANAGVSFGSTAPLNPVRGHFWWDGTTLWMFDGAAWVDTSTGGGTPPSTTAPANPQPGQQWFNGSTLFVWDGNAWVPVSQTKTSVQATAPPAPNPGDMWWDGTQFRIWDGSAWRMVGPGATVGPVPTVTHVFQITNPTASIVPTTAPLGIWAPTSTPTIDSLAAWNSTTHQYLPKTAGVYFFTTRTPTTGTYSSHTLLKNDGGSWVLNSNIYITVASVASATAQNQWLGSSGMVVMNGSTDFVRLWAADSTGSLYAAGVLPFIDAYLLP